MMRTYLTGLRRAYSPVLAAIYRTVSRRVGASRTVMRSECRARK